MHTFSEWLTLSKLKPIDRNSNKKKEDKNYNFGYLGFYGLTILILYAYLNLI